MDSKRKLTKKQKLFVKKYCIHFNGSQAALEAGYAKGSARITGSKLLSNPNIKKAIEKITLRTSEKFEISKERIIEELCNIAFVDPIDVYNLKGRNLTIKDLNDIPKNVRVAISSIDTINVAGSNEVVFRINFHKKHPAFDLLAKMNGYIVDKKEISGPDGQPLIGKCDVNVNFVKPKGEK